MNACKICLSPTASFEHPKLKKSYHHCTQCDFIYLDPCFHVSQAAEKKQYDQHNNCIENLGYVQMFENFITFIQNQTASNKLQSLDFGSGPGAVLSQLLLRHGHEVSIYDPFF
ncbi:MAG: class I SAM-dependent methyltransferase, partial [Thiovulaceae bacterium]|nr:class I SAM-dependent methyltransferase [Sulfurimonadaceae bacterium]